MSDDRRVDKLSKVEVAAYTAHLRQRLRMARVVIAVAIGFAGMHLTWVLWRCRERCDGFSIGLLATYVTAGTWAIVGVLRARKRLSGTGQHVAAERLLDRSVAMSQGSIMAPIVLIDGDDIRVFGSIGALERAIEPLDATDPAITAIDSSGRLLHIHVECEGCLVDRPSGLAGERTVVSLRAGAPDASRWQPWLVAQLQSAAARTGKPSGLTGTEPWELVARAAAQLYGLSG